MQVSFNPRVNYNQSFQARKMLSSDDVTKYMDKIADTRDIADLKETIRLTREAGKDLLVKLLKMDAEDLGIKLD